MHITEQERATLIRKLAFTDPNIQVGEYVYIRYAAVSGKLEDFAYNRASIYQPPYMTFRIRLGDGTLRTEHLDHIEWVKPPKPEPTSNFAAELFNDMVQMNRAYQGVQL